MQVRVLQRSFSSVPVLAALIFSLAPVMAVLSLSSAQATRQPERGPPSGRGHPMAGRGGVEGMTTQ
jgi:hypothetical protein